MAGLPVVSGARAVRALTRTGFVLDRIVAAITCSFNLAILCAP
jgi:hypothetical protein